MLKAIVLHLVLYFLGQDLNASLAYLPSSRSGPTK